MKRTPKVWLVVFLIAAIATPSLLAFAQSPTALSNWLLQLQSLGAKYRKGDTNVQTDAAYEEFIKALAKEHEGKKIQFTTEVTEVRWAKEGIATISTGAERGKDPLRTPTTPLSISRHLPFQVRMTQAQAVAIKPGTQLRFKGTVNFHPGMWGDVGSAKKGVQLYTLRHEYLGGLYAGTFTSNDGVFQIGGRQYDHPWVKEIEDSRKEKQEEKQEPANK